MSLVIVITLTASACSTLPPAPPQRNEYTLPPASSGPVSEAAMKFAETQGDETSGFLPLVHNREALLWRLMLTDRATRSLDVQYFIWEGDEAGDLLFDRLLKAAERGVHIRLLVDDLVLAAKDRDLSAISNHSNIKIKLFNPGAVRNSTAGTAGEFLFNFRELNRRMHNKLFVVDNRLAIVGGRNIGNPYFGLSENYNFLDLDVLVTGPVVEKISSAFDQYWNSPLAYPGSALSNNTTPAEFQDIRNTVSRRLIGEQDLLRSYPLESGRWEDEFEQLPSRMRTGKALFLQDKAEVLQEKTDRLGDMLDNLADPIQTEFIIVTPYLIPVPGFLEQLEEMSAQGVQVKILTGSLASNNQTAAHSHYKKYRRRILAMGAELYEFRHDPSPEVRAISDVAPVRSKFLSLHIKALVGDREHCFAGSLNLDPRALEINTENGLYIRSADLCGQLAEHFDILMQPDNAWRVYLNEDDQLRWVSSSGTVSIQPARSFTQRIADFFFRLLPLESQL
jgi:putative cardiolipin synthase